MNSRKAQWRANCAAESESSEHPCNRAEPLRCFCKGSCACHARAGYTVPEVLLNQGGWRAEIERMLFTYRIIVTNGHDVEFLWCYHSAKEAALAIAEWGSRRFKDEPEGWHRAKAPGDAFRRRPDGDAMREYSDDDPEQLKPWSSTGKVTL